MSSQAGPVVILESWTEDSVKRALTPGGTVFVEGMVSVFVLGEDGAVDELSPSEHAEWHEVGTTHGIPQSDDDVDIYDNDFINSQVGRIGSIYFEQIIDPWQLEWLGEFESDEEALEHAADGDFSIKQ